MEFETFSDLERCYRQNGVQYILVKKLAENDNSKNQIYLGSGYSVLQDLPSGQWREQQAPEGCTRTRIRLKAGVEFYWTSTARFSQAPYTQLILYPQYPEVRLSGFLYGCERAPSQLMSARLAGRILFMGIAGNRVLAYVAHPESCLAQDRYLHARLRAAPECGVLRKIYTQPANIADNLRKLLEGLKAVNQQRWIESRRLDREGRWVPCHAPNCGGYTLEASFGITPNGAPLPDYLGWELKAIRSAAWPGLAPAARITLMTPEPVFGLYVSDMDLFRARYAHPVRPNAEVQYFTGCRPIGRAPRAGGLVMELRGFSGGRVTAPDAAIILLDKERDCIAAGWSLSSVLNHWRAKHAQTAYVPYKKREGPLSFWYSPRIILGFGDDFQNFLEGCSKGLIVYDPAVKFKQHGTRWSVDKKRNQFRTVARNLCELYTKIEDINLEEF